MKTVTATSNIVICDDERDYALHLLEYLKQREMPYEICAFFSREKMLQKAAPETTAVLIIAESEYNGDVYNAGYGRILILNETDAWLGENPPNVSKYQSMENIYQVVMNLCVERSQESGEQLPSSIRHTSSMKIIGVYSPISRCLQTTVSFTIGQLLARKHKTLYMNFENFSGLSAMLNRTFRGSVSDLLYYNECAREKLAGQLSLMTEDVSGLSVLPPMHSFMELQSIRKDQWLELFRTIEKVTDYEYLILDLSESTDGLLDILRECSEVITLQRPDCAMSEAKMQEYRSILAAGGYEDVYAKTRRWRLPQFHDLPAGLENLTRSELAARVRKLLRTDEG